MYFVKSIYSFLFKESVPTSLTTCMWCFKRLKEKNAAIIVLTHIAVVLVYVGHLNNEEVKTIINKIQELKSGCVLWHGSNQFQSSMNVVQ